MNISLIPAVYAKANLGLDVAKQVGLQGGLPDRILTIVNNALLIVAVIALAYIVYGGFRYVVSRGNEQEVLAAKGTLLYAVVGIVVIGVAAALVNFVVDAILGR